VEWRRSLLEAKKKRSSVSQEKTRGPRRGGGVGDGRRTYERKSNEGPINSLPGRKMSVPREPDVQRERRNPPMRRHAVPSQVGACETRDLREREKISVVRKMGPPGVN